jgi:FixJ family two-component response regulator
MASGCIAYLTKPFLARSLIEPIERALASMA